MFENLHVHVCMCVFVVCPINRTVCEDVCVHAHCYGSVVTDSDAF